MCYHLNYKLQFPDKGALFAGSSFVQYDFGMHSYQKTQSDNQGSFSICLAKFQLEGEQWGP